MAPVRPSNQRGRPSDEGSSAVLRKFLRIFGHWENAWNSESTQLSLVGGIPTHLKNMSSSVGMIIPNIWKNKTCSKPPTRSTISVLCDLIMSCLFLYENIWKYHPNITQNNLIERASFLSFPYLAQQLNSPHHPIRYNPWGTGAVRRLVASVCHCNSKFQSHVVLPLLNVACGQHSNGHLTCKVWYHLRSYYITKWYDTSRMINRMIDNMRMRKGFSHSFEPVSGVIQHPTLWVPICTPCRLCCDHMPIIGMIFPWLSPYVPLSKKLLHWFLHSHETTNRH